MRAALLQGIGPLAMPQDPAFFKVIAEAYSTLSHEHKRMRYDEKVHEEQKTHASKNEKYAKGGGAAYARYGEGAAAASSAAAADAVFRGAMTNALGRIREDAYVRGRVKRLHRTRVDVPSQRSSMMSMAITPALVAVAGAILAYMLWSMASSDTHEESRLAAARAAGMAQGRESNQPVSNAQASAMARLEEEEAQAASRSASMRRWRSQGALLGDER